MNLCSHCTINCQTVCFYVMYLHILLNCKIMCHRLSRDLCIIRRATDSPLKTRVAIISLFLKDWVSAEGTWPSIVSTVSRAHPRCPFNDRVDNQPITSRNRPFGPCDLCHTHLFYCDSKLLSAPGCVRLLATAMNQCAISWALSTPRSLLH